MTQFYHRIRFPQALTVVGVVDVRCFEPDSAGMVVVLFIFVGFDMGLQR